MGRWPQGQMRMRNGRTVRWGLSSRPTGDQMELAWENVTYAEAEQLARLWELNYGIYGQLTLPTQTLAGTSEALGDFLALPFPGATWHFIGPPVIESVKAGRCTIRMPIGVRGFNRYDT